MHHQVLLQVQAQVQAQVLVLALALVQAQVLAHPFRMLQQKHLLFFLIPFYRLPELQVLQLQEEEPV